MYKKFEYCSHKQDVQVMFGEKDIIKRIDKTSFQLTSRMSQTSQIALTFCIFATIGDFTIYEKSG